MCFKISIGEKAKIAERNIPCFKFLKVFKEKRTLILTSPFQGTTWEEKKINKLKKKFSQKATSRSISTGFHSLKSISSAIEFGKKKRAKEKNWELFKFIIPKGSFYRVNKTEYVSNSIMLKSNISIPYDKR